MRYLIVIFSLVLSLESYSQERTLAPNFSVKLMDSTVIQLEDYKGQVVYISFWASWCGPCLTNFEKYKEIRDQLEKEGVVLLNVSIDENSDKWQAAVERLKINGIHALAKKENLYPQYQISSIPLYEIVAKNGHFLYLSDASGRDIIGQFKEWISK